jgi:hypothetical protein
MIFVHKHQDVKYGIKHMQANQRKQAERAEHNSMSLILADKN